MGKQGVMGSTSLQGGNCLWLLGADELHLKFLPGLCGSFRLLTPSFPLLPFVLPLGAGVGAAFRHKATSPSPLALCADLPHRKL